MGHIRKYPLRFHQKASILYNYLCRKFYSKMIQYRNLTIEKAVANQSGAMEADTISKNGRNLKSQKSRVNLTIGGI